MPGSDALASGVFVHARRSDGTSRLVGRYRLVGSIGGQRSGEFAYVGSWLQDTSGQAFPLDPQNLPLTRGPILAKRRGLLPGALADATPDRWGRRLVQAVMPDRYPTMTAEDWLLATDDERVGCLAFSRHPPSPNVTLGHLAATDLADIAEGFDKLDRGETATIAIERLYRAGHSLGGARPKAVVAQDHALWLAKFQRRDDDYDQCAAEHATMQLARLCGIHAAETRLVSVGPRRAVLVKRFDRTSGETSFHPTAHYLSALSALALDETDTGGSYVDIARFIRRFCQDHVADRRQLFRRMLFNVVCGNRDDHLKNHAFLRRESGVWCLSPAFDIVPQPDMEAMQAIDLGILGGLPTVANCLSHCGEFGLGAEEAASIADDIVRRLRSWRDVFLASGADEATIRKIARAFSPSPGRQPG